MQPQGTSEEIATEVLFYVRLRGRYIVAEGWEKASPWAQKASACR